MSIPEPEFRKASRRAIFGMALVFLAIALIVAAFIARRTGYPESVRVDVLSGCRRGGGTPSACACYLGELEKEFTFDQYTVLAKKIPPPQVFADISAACASK